MYAWTNTSIKTKIQLVILVILAANFAVNGLKEKVYLGIWNYQNHYKKIAKKYRPSLYWTKPEFLQYL